MSPSIRFVPSAIMASYSPWLRVMFLQHLPPAFPPTEREATDRVVLPWSVDTVRNAGYAELMTGSRNSSSSCTLSKTMSRSSGLGLTISETTSVSSPCRKDVSPFVLPMQEWNRTFRFVAAGEFKVGPAGHLLQQPPAHGLAVLLLGLSVGLCMGVPPLGGHDHDWPVHADTLRPLLRGELQDLG